MVYITAVVSRRLRRHIQFDEVDDLAGQPATQIADDLAGDADRDQAQRHRTEYLAFTGPGDLDVGEFPCERGISGILGVNESHALFEVQRIDHITLALMQIHRARVHRSGGLAGIRRSPATVRFRSPR